MPNHTLIHRIFGGAPAQVRTNLNEIAQAFMTGRSAPGGGEEWGPDQIHSTVYTCETIIATGAAWVPYKLWEVDSVKRYIEIDEANSPLLQLLNNPWPGMYSDLAQMVETIFYNLESEGNAWILEDRPNSRGLPRALIVLGVQHVSPLKSVAGKLLGWEIKMSAMAKPIQVPPQGLIHIKYTHPFSRDQILGFGPLGAARLNVRGDRAKNSWEAGFYKNGARPSFALTYKPPDTRSDEIFLNEKQLEQIRHGIESEWGGQENAGKVAIIHGGMTLEQFAVSQKDMDLVESKKWSRQDIAGVFRIPVPLLNDFQHAGLGREGVSVADRMLYSNNIVPKLKRLSKIFQRVFVDKYEKGRVGAFDIDEIPAMRDDMGDKAEVASKFHKMGWPINAINRVLDLGFEDVEWGNDWWLPNNMMTTKQIAEAIEQQTTPVTAGEVIAETEAQAEADAADAADAEAEDTGTAMLVPSEKVISGCSRLLYELRSEVLKSLDTLLQDASQYDYIPEVTLNKSYWSEAIRGMQEIARRAGTPPQLCRDLRVFVKAIEHRLLTTLATVQASDLDRSQQEAAIRATARAVFSRASHRLPALMSPTR